MQSNINYSASDSQSPSFPRTSKLQSRAGVFQKRTKRDDPIIPSVLQSATLNPNFPLFLRKIDNSQSLVEFFNLYYQHDWLRTKYDPAYRTDLMLARMSGLTSNLKSYVNSYFGNNVLSFLRGDLNLNSLFENNDLEGDSLEDPDIEYFGILKDRYSINRTQRMPDNYLLVKSIPLAFPRETIENALKKLPGFQELILTDPNEVTLLRRTGYIVFSSREEKLQGEEFLNKHHFEEFNDFKLLVVSESHSDASYSQASENSENSYFGQNSNSLHKNRIRVPIKPTPSCFTLLPRLLFDTIHAFKLFYLLSSSPLTSRGQITSNFSSILTSVQSLFLINHFIMDALRDLHCFCYYCGKSFINKDELFSRCGLYHDLPYNSLFSLLTDNRVSSTPFPSSSSSIEDSVVSYYNNISEAASLKLNKDEIDLLLDSERLVQMSNENIEEFIKSRTLPSTPFYTALNFSFFEALQSTQNSSLSSFTLLNGGGLDVPHMRVEEGEIAIEETFVPGFSHNNYNNSSNSSSSRGMKKSMSEEERLNKRLHTAFYYQSEEEIYSLNNDQFNPDSNHNSSHNPHSHSNHSPNYMGGHGEHIKVEGSKLEVLVDFLGRHNSKVNLPKHYYGLKTTWLQEKISKIINFRKEEGKLECGLCDKLFSGKNFLNKHMLRMHVKEIMGIVNENYFKEYFLNYYKDEYKLNFDKFKEVKNKREKINMIKNNKRNGGE